MAKLTVYHKIIGLGILLLSNGMLSFAQYRLRITGVDRSAAFITDTLKVQQDFGSRENCIAYVNRLPEHLAAKGFDLASVDTVRFDSLEAHCSLYVGDAAGEVHLNTDSVDPSILQQVGYGRMSRRKIRPDQFPGLQEKILNHLENNGYPFAAVSIDSVRVSGGSLHAVLNIEKGPLYRIDSIRNAGTASISSQFLQQFLGIRNGSIYKKERLQDISSRLRELPFLQEKQRWDLSLLGTGSILNVYLDARKSSEVNVLLGLLPANEQLANNKLLVTGEANINLKNALGNGETIGLNWQQIQVKSPRLNILFQQPYLFGSPFGMNFNFDLFKKDSSFVNISILVGAAYAVSSRRGGSVFIQRLTTNLLTVDTFSVKRARRLPAEADLGSVNLGLTYDWLTTDYRFNPRKGNELNITASVGTKTIRKNNVIVKLYDNADPSFNFNALYDTLQLKSYQFRIKAKAVRYFPVSRASTVKASLEGGWFQSPNVFRNELFQIGGYKLMRGFDEESIFTSRYAVATGEYRYLLGQNSFLAAFADYGISANPAAGSGANRFLGAGLGMAFETKAGIFNISYAAGKRDDQKFNLRQSKIHLGYVNYF